MSGMPGAICWPSWAVRCATTPSTGACSRIWASTIMACRSRATAARTSGWVATLVPRTSAMACASALCAESRPACAEVTASRACASSSADTAAPAVGAAAAVVLRLHQRDLGGGEPGAQLVHLQERAAHAAHGAREIGFRRLHRHLGLDGIELDQELAAAHALGVVGMQGDDRAGFLAGDGDDVAADIGVVGGLEMAGIEEPVEPVDNSGDRDDGAENDQPAPTGAIIMRCGCGVTHGQASVLDSNRARSRRRPPSAGRCAPRRCRRPARRRGGAPRSRGFRRRGRWIAD